jgi:hypothetical protein
MDKTERLQNLMGNKGDLHSTDYLPALFLVVACVFLPKGYGSEGLRSLAIIFVSIVLEAIPFMLAGSLIGGLLEAFISRERMAAILPKRVGSQYFLQPCRDCFPGMRMRGCACSKKAYG